MRSNYRGVQMPPVMFHGSENGKVDACLLTVGHDTRRSYLKEFYMTEDCTFCHHLKEDNNHICDVGILRMEIAIARNNYHSLKNWTNTTIDRLHFKINELENKISK